MLQREPSTLVALFLVLVMHLLCGVSQNPARFLLDGFQASHRALLTRNGVTLDGETNAVIDSMPTDLRTVLDAFEPEIKLVTTAWVCCPMCYKLHTNEDTVKQICDYMEFEGGLTCEALLYCTWKIQGKNRSHPIRCYIHQPLGHWLAWLLARPGMEKLMDNILPQTTQMPVELHNIWDASKFRNFIGPDGKPFVLCNDTEGCLMFGLSFDGFNPHRVMATGKHGSVSTIYMVCFNLPSHIRFHTENMYLVGIAPRPSKPSQEQINHLLKPVIDELKLFWQPGVVISRMPSCHGRGVSSLC